MDKNIIMPWSSTD